MTARLAGWPPAQHPPRRQAHKRTCHVQHCCQMRRHDGTERAGVSSRVHRDTSRRLRPPLPHALPGIPPLLQALYPSRSPICRRWDYHCVRRNDCPQVFAPRTSYGSRSRMDRPARRYRNNAECA